MIYSIGTLSISALLWMRNDKTTLKSNVFSLTHKTNLQGFCSEVHLDDQRLFVESTANQRKAVRWNILDSQHVHHPTSAASPGSTSTWCSWFIEEARLYGWFFSLQWKTLAEFDLASVCFFELNVFKIIDGRKKKEQGIRQDTRKTVSLCVHGVFYLVPVWCNHGQGEQRKLHLGKLNI